MDSTYPTAASSQQTTFRTTFGTSEAEYDILEQSIRNGNSRNRNMQRSNTDLGDKTSVSETWIVSGDISLS